MAANTVLGVFNRDRLPDALAALHRDGYGPNTRVLDAARGPLAGQLERAGVAAIPPIDDSVHLLLMVFAPARVGAVVGLLQRNGSTQIHLVERPHSYESSPLLRGLVQAPTSGRRAGSSARKSRPIPAQPASDSTGHPSPAD
ncbi:MAG TPA: hypothetical protein VFL82_08850 [Thermomicrobiales bacterium]|nr:hypothetical protein [Thermomicrobiales bacterium]